MTITPTSPWERAIRRALRERLKATLRADGTFRVASVSKPGTFHTVRLDECGRIIHCSECKGWENGGRERPCKHAGAVALAIAALKGATLQSPAVTPADLGVADFRPGKSNLFRTVGA
jgi:hypothetical protein